MLDPQCWTPTLHNKQQLKWIKYLNIWGKTTTLLKENILVSLYDFGLGSDFLVMTLKAQVGKEK